MKSLNDMSSSQTLRKFIMVVEDVLTPDACAEIIKGIANSGHWRPAVIVREGGLVDNSVRNCDTLLISDLAKTNPEFVPIDQLLFQGASKALAEYSRLCAASFVDIDTGYEALRYTEGGFYMTHFDSGSGQDRTLSCSFALNDDYEGGEWGFFGEEIKIKAKAGSAVLFPSNFLFPHQILPVTKGTRYSTITWFK